MLLASLLKPSLLHYRGLSLQLLKLLSLLQHLHHLSKLSGATTHRGTGSSSSPCHLPASGSSSSALHLSLQIGSDSNHNQHRRPGKELWHPGFHERSSHTLSEHGFPPCFCDRL
jgi:hypothetical protein